MLFVWMGMVPGDDRAKALESARALADRRATHLWDPDNRFGLLCTEHLARPHLDELRQAMAGDEYALSALDQLASGEATFPTWDAALFYRAGATWTDPLPSPDGWMKQFDYAGDGDADDPGGFWTSHTPQARVDSNWLAEFDRGLAAVIDPPLSGR